MKAIERLRDNNMGTEAKEWKWDQFWETFMDPKTYLWFSLLFLAAYVFTVHHFEPAADNVYYRLYRLPSGGIGAFGPLIIQGFGFDSVSWRIALSVVRDYSFYRVVPEYLVQHAIRRIINRGYPRLCLAHQ